MSQEKYNLTWHTYTDHLKDMMKDLMEKSRFADVSLICEDRKTIKAHKNILSASSPIFKDILEADTSSNCNIYLRGVNYLEMLSILQFIYLGEASFHEERVNEFLSVAKTLEIKELSRDVESNITEESTSTITDQEENEQPSTNILTEDQEKDLNHLLDQEVMKSLDNKFNCKKCGKEFSTSRGVKLHFKTVHQGFKYPCSHCDYQATQKSALKTHFDAYHEGLKYQCNLCEMQFTFQSVLTRHIQTVHKGKELKQCNQCEYQTANTTHLRQHIQTKHEGVRYACHYCDHQASDTSNLKRHIERHEGVKYACNQCEAQFTQQNSLKKHIQFKHEGIAFKCTFAGCKSEFSSNYNLKKHLKSLMHQQ